jgi:hypothetical protein
MNQIKIWFFCERCLDFHLVDEYMNILKRLFKSAVFVIVLLAIPYTLHGQQARCIEKSNIAELLSMNNHRGGRLTDDSLKVRKEAFLKERILAEMERKNHKPVSMLVLYNDRGKRLRQSEKKIDSAAVAITAENSTGDVVGTKSSLENTVVSESGSQLTKVQEVLSSSAGEAVSKSVNISAGGLYNALTSSERSSITSLTVTGTMDARDFKTMRNSMGNLTDIDLSGVTIVSYTGTGGTDTVGLSKTYEANAIPQFAFCYNPKPYYTVQNSFVHNLTSVNLPTSLSKIGNFAFYNNDSLTSIIIPTSVTHIGDFAFYDGGITSVTINADSIGEAAFYCANLTNVVFTSDVKVIGYQAFAGCVNLPSIDIPSTVSKIEELAFSGCAFNTVTIAADTISELAFLGGYIRSVIITNDVNQIGWWAFALCDSLTSVSIGSKVIGPEVFSCCGQLKNVELLDSVQIIGDRAFYECISLNSISIPSSVDTVDIAAFSGCTGMVSATISANTINPFAFYDCTSLKKVKFSTGVSTLSTGVFQECTEIDTIQIPSSIDFIGGGAFAYCKGPFFVDESNRNYSSVNGVLYNKSQSELIQCSKSIDSLIIPNSVHSIGMTSFFCCDSLKSVTIPSSVDSVGVGAFYFCKNLSSVLIPSTVKYIDQGAFAACLSLEKVSLPVGLKAIAPSMFRQCANLHTITLPSTVDTIGISAFAYCGQLDTIYCENVIPAVAQILTEDNFYYYFRNQFPEVWDIQEALEDLIYDSGDVDNYGVIETGNNVSEFRKKSFLYNFIYYALDLRSGDYQSWGSSSSPLSAFDGVDTTSCSILVPQAGLDAYKLADQWKSFSRILAIKEFSLPAQMDTLPQTGGSIPLVFTTNTNWQVTVDKPWLSVDQYAGSGTDTLSLSAIANTSIQPREATLTFQADDVGTRILSVVQSGTGIRQLSITKPKIDSLKVYDATNSAIIREMGELQNVDSLTASRVEVTASAHFNNAVVGSSKSIIIEYALSGTDSVWYKTPTNDTIFNAVIQAKKLSATGIEVQKSKSYDGTSQATIVKAGSLQGVIPVDSAAVNLITTATYDDAEVGGNKSITLTFSLTGSSSGNYLAPSDSIVAGAEIMDVPVNDSITLDSIVVDASICPGTAFDIPYVIKSGTPTQYRIDFDNTANSAGLVDVEYTDFPTSGQVIEVVLPDGMSFGTYHATFQVRSSSGVESVLYPFQFNVLLSSDYIIGKFDDIILFDNSSQKFASYQWYKNGLLIDGATQQYYIDSEGLIGSYSVKVTTNDGEEVWTCSKSFNIPLEPEVSVAVFPNPAKANQPVTIRIAGMSDTELQGASLSVHDLNGIQVSSYNRISTDNQFVFGRSDGAYIGYLVMPSGRVIQFMVVIK